MFANRLWSLSAASLAAAVTTGALGAASPPPSTIEAPPSKIMSWEPGKSANPAHFRFGGMTLTLRAVRDREYAEMWHPVAVVEAEGRPPKALELDFGTQPLQFGFGRIDKVGTPFLYLQNYTGGAHCCNSIDVVIASKAAFEVVHLGEWDGGAQETFPVDEDGDGNIDFVQTDDRFRYAFASGAGSYTPPQVLNISNGMVVDVSSRPRFRRIFINDMQKAKKYCSGKEAVEPNGGCAAFVADAARAGLWDQAWAEMLKAYDPTSTDFPEGCKVDVGAGECPASSKIKYFSYPEALRAFLLRYDYVR